MRTFILPNVRMVPLVRMATVATLLVFLTVATPMGKAIPAQARPLGATAAEIASLGSIYNALGGAAWTTSTNWPAVWPTASDPCVDDWYGITCNPMLSG